MKKETKNSRAFYLVYDAFNGRFNFKETLRFINLTLETSGTFRCEVSYVRSREKIEGRRLVFPGVNTTITVLGRLLFDT